jgi:branched-chain amino acid transport system substrate-binding protein
MAIGRRSILAALGIAATQWPARAQSKRVKIGWLGDLSGPQSDITGILSVESARLAIADFGGTALGQPIEFVSADHQNQPDVGLAIARRWYDRDGVDVIVDCSNSAIALAVNGLAGQARKLIMYSSPITDKMVEADCNGHGLAWTWDTYSVIRAGALTQLKAGYDSWFVIGFDYLAGIAYEQALRTAVEESGGKIVGAVRAPLGTTDYSSFLLRAQASGARLVAITLGGADMINCVKQAREFGLHIGSQKLALLYAFESDIASAGLEALQGLELVTAFYWDMDEQTRAYAKRIYAKYQRMPNMIQAGVYSDTLQYLRAVDVTRSTDPATVVAYLQTIPIDDMFARHGRLRANGRLIHDIYSVRIKTPAESRYPYDFLEVRDTIPAEKAFRSLDESKCPRVRT